MLLSGAAPAAALSSTSAPDQPHTVELQLRSRQAKNADDVDVAELVTRLGIIALIAASLGVASTRSSRKRTGGEDGPSALLDPAS
jgi:hypothetical protein